MKNFILSLILGVGIFSSQAKAADLVLSDVYCDLYFIIMEIHYDGKVGSMKRGIPGGDVLVEDNNMSVTEANGIRTYTGKDVIITMNLTKKGESFPDGSNEVMADSNPTEAWKKTNPNVGYVTGGTCVDKKYSEWPGFTK